MNNRFYRPRCENHPQNFADSCMDCWIESIMEKYNCSRDEANSIIESIIFDDQE